MLNTLGGTGTKVIVGLAAGVVLGLAVSEALAGDRGRDCPGKLSASMADVLDATKYSWKNMGDEGDFSGYDTKGEPDHPLLNPDGTSTAKASIHRVNKSSKRKASCFENKVVAVAKIQSTANYSPLYLSPGDNYFVVWHDMSEDPDPRDNPNPKSWHGAIVNKDARNQITFMYEEHWKKGNKPTDPDLEPLPPPELDPVFDECWKWANGTRRACFGDVKAQVTPTPGMGFGLGMFPLRNGGSEPWVSCASNGCCCGGTSCHDGGT